MSTIWYESLDKGLKEEIINSIKCLDKETGEVINLPSNHVFFVRPEDEYKEEVYPSVHVTHLFEKHDKVRYNPNQMVVTRNIKEGTVGVKNHPVSFTIYFQLDFYSKYQTEINLMSSTWLQSHFRQFNLNVIDSDNDEVTVNALSYEDMKSQDYMDGYDRIYRRIVSYKVWVELDSDVVENKPMVTNINVNTDNK